MRSIQLSAILIAVAVLIGCQSGGGKMSVENAKKLASGLQRSTYTPPKRSISDILKTYQWVGERSCVSGKAVTPGERRITIKARIENSIPWTGGGGRTKRSVAEEASIAAYLRGNIGNAVMFAKWMMEATQNSAHDAREYTGFHAVGYHSQAFFEAYSGDLIAAKESLGDGDSSNAVWYKAPVYMDQWSRFLAYRAEAAIARMEGDLDQAVSLFSEAINETDIALGKMDGPQGRWGHVKNYYQSRFAGFKALLEADLAETLARRGQLLEAESLLRRTLGRGTLRIGGGNDGLLRLAVLQRLASVVYEQGRFDEARQLAELLIRGYDGLCDSGGLAAASVRELLAKAYLGLGQTKAAYETFTALGEALLEDRRLLDLKFGGSLYWGLAELLGGNPVAADRRLQTSLMQTRQRMGEDSLREAEIKGVMGLSNKIQGNTAKAHTLLKQATTVFYNSKSKNAGGTDKSAKYWLRTLIVEAYLDLLTQSNQPADQRRSFQVAQILENGNVQQALHQNAVRTGSGNPELNALIRQEQDLTQQIAILHQTLSAALSSTDNSGSGIGKSIKESLPKLIAARRSLAGEIASRFPRYSSMTNPLPLSVTDAQAALGPNDALLVIQTLKERTFVWAIPKKGDIAFKAVDIGKDALEKIVSRLRKAVDPGAIASLGDIPAFDLNGAYGLYEKLLKPVEAGWKRSRSINLVVKGPLAQLPLSLLPTEPVRAAPRNLLFGEYQGLPWLARSHALSVLPSVSSLTAFALNKDKKDNRRPFIGFGDPYFNPSQALDAESEALVQVADAAHVRGVPVKLRSSPRTRSVNSADLSLLPRLPETRIELENIAANMNANPENSIFTGRRANEQQIKTMKLDDVRVLAFATHGLIPGDLNGLDQPALALSAPKVAGVDGDGLLTMGEVLGLKLNADWVVLSACNTASADGQGAEAVSGLGRAFFYAGARSLLVSNWPVHSGATAHLTSTLFYLQAKEKGLGRSAALQKTRIEMIDTATQKDARGQPLFSYAHPIFWAPFIIVGDGGGGT